MRTDKGVEGVIVSIFSNEVSAVIRLDRQPNAVHVLRLDTLTRSDGRGGGAGISVAPRTGG